MFKIFLFGLLTVLSIFPSISYSLPKAVILIRHAEEPKGNETDLSKTGIERSKRLVKLFKDHPKLKKLGAPVALFGAGAKDKDSSVRSVQTLHYLSQSIKVPINDSYMRDDIKDLTEEILENNDYDDKVIVVCWQHTLLTSIVKKLGIKNAPEYPHSKYDRLWVMTFDKKGKRKPKIKLDDLPQKIMLGDDSK